jgi:uncharacterized protein (DUF1501 family)
MTPTRREFLRSAIGTSAVLSLGSAVPEFWRKAAASESTPGETVLVVIQLTGGNDGLNTVIPHADPLYRKNRPKLAIPTSDVLRITDQLGWLPACRGMADLLEAGKLAVVQGVGYPEPNRSHFESMDIWHTCLRKDANRNTGWLGRYLDAAFRSDVRDAPALHLGGEKQPLALAAQDVRVPSIESLESFQLQNGGDQRLSELVGDLSQAPRSEQDSLLSFVQSNTTAALTASQRVALAREGYRPGVTYPEDALSARLRTMAQLIDAGLATRVYYTELDGFDTHSQQPAAHAALLGQLSGSLAAFIQDVAHHGHGDRVAVMVFSEFGRRVQENASEGTDHGAAAPMFLAGHRVNSGLSGTAPKLDDLLDGDIQFETDFRQVYASVLDEWLGWPSSAVVGEGHSPLDIFKT